MLGSVFIQALVYPHSGADGRSVGRGGRIEIDQNHVKAVCVLCRLPLLGTGTPNAPTLLSPHPHLLMHCERRCFSPKIPSSPFFPGFY